MSSVLVVSYIDGYAEVYFASALASMRDGLCIGKGDTYEAALHAARADLENALTTVRQLQDGGESAPGGRPMKARPNNYFHVRVYTDDGGKLEIFRDKAKPSTRAQIIDGLKRAIGLIEAMDAPRKLKP